MSERNKTLDELFGKPAFANLGEQRIELFRRFAAEIEGKNPFEIAARLVRFNSQLSKEQPLTPEQREAIARAIKESLSEEDRQKYGGLFKLI